MSIRIIDPGLQSSVQDLGRPGCAHLGLPAGGAADALSLVIGNRIVGNHDSAAAIEMAVRPCSVTFDADATVCVTGAFDRAEVVGRDAGCRRIAAGEATHVDHGSTLTISMRPRQMRAYLCVSGGIDTPIVLGSRSAYLPASLGAFCGPLKTGDVLSVGSATAPARPWPRSGSAELLALSTSGGRVRFVRACSDAPVDELLIAAFIVSPQSNRMGIRLKGRSSGVPAHRSMISEGTACGAIQLPTDAEPIILFVDRPTTGGYRVAATVIAADLPVLGQLAPGDEVRFQEVERDEAICILRRQRKVLDELLPPVITLSRTIDLNCDLGEGLPPEHDEALMGLVTSVNIACGGHAGDESTMDRTVRMAMKHGCRIGAHPGFPDRANFGRRMMSMPPEELERSLVEQITTLMRIARDAGARVAYIKPHGALYNAAMTDPVLADSIACAVRRCDPKLAIMGLAGAPALGRWMSAGFDVISEAFADRRYDGDGRLRGRDHADALITDPEDAAAQAVKLARESAANTLCVHADTPNAMGIAASIRDALHKAQISISPLSSG